MTFSLCLFACLYVWGLSRRNLNNWEGCRTSQASYTNIYVMSIVFNGFTEKFPSIHNSFSWSIVWLDNFVSFFRQFGVFLLHCCCFNIALLGLHPTFQCDLMEPQRLSMLLLQQIGSSLFTKMARSMTATVTNRVEKPGWKLYAINLARHVCD